MTSSSGILDTWPSWIRIRMRVNSLDMFQQRRTNDVIKPIEIRCVSIKSMFLECYDTT